MMHKSLTTSCGNEANILAAHSQAKSGCTRDSTFRKTKRRCVVKL